MNEEWRLVPSFPRYQASNLGRIRTKHRIIKQHLATNGYLMCGLVDELKRCQHCRRAPTTTVSVHVVIAEAFYGQRPSRQDVCHNNGNRLDNCSANLRYATRSDNMLDAIKHGTARFGGCHPDAILDEAEVAEVKALRGIISADDVGAAYGLHPQSVYSIWSGRTWKHVPWPEI